MPSALELDRAAGALWGLAIGDALGMPAQLLTRPDVVANWGPLLAWFEPPDPGHPVAGGLPAGSVTDDTEQAVLLARLLLAGNGHVAPVRLARALLEWEDGMRARGSADLLGPSTRRALDAVRAGVPVDRAGRQGDTNGAAMRVAPVGIIVPADDLLPLVDRVVEVSAVTHGTGPGLGAAAAVAAAVSAGIAGTGPDAACGTALVAARLAAERGARVPGSDVAAGIDRACRLVRDVEEDLAVERVVGLVGTGLSARESVPAAFAVASRHPADPWLAVRTAASLGGDTDTIAAIAGAVTGAWAGRSAFPPEAVRTVREVNGLDLDDLARRLLELRHAPAAPT
ncbi:MAG TPA: ADP-ribosylglycohydrolase family protein [Kineosporiaceae bacterium]|nr:ADP-ribosylglycohydrolase family protein [Kineosporiaceae bacterium]